MSVARIIELHRDSLTDVNVFLESLFAGNNFKQGGLHREGQAWLSEHAQCMICWPRDHGKTTQIAGRCAWEIGRTPRIRVKYCCEADDVAYHRSRFIRRIVKDSAWFKFVFPDVRPDEPWGDISWTVTRPALTVDPTFNALGVGTASTGGRADLLIADDLVGVKQLRSRQLREQCKTYWSNNLVNLCEPDARIWVIYTPWTASDLNADLERKLPVLRRPVGPNCEPVWPEHWPHAALQARLAAIGRLPFARGYQLQVVSEGETILGDQLHLVHAPTTCYRCVFGVDVAVKQAESNDRSAIAVLKHDGTRWVIVQCWSARTSTTELMSVLASMAAMHKPQAIAYEDTGMQEGIWQLARQLDCVKPIASLLRPVQHTKNKVARLEAAAPHFASGFIAFAGSDFMVAPELQLLWDEITTAPLNEHDDTWDAVLTGFEFATIKKQGEIR